MTYTYHVGEPASTRSDWPRPTLLPFATASSGPGGVRILVALDAPGAPERLAVESGPIALGVAEGGDVSEVRVRIGTPGQPGYVEVSAELDVGLVWWGADVELGLCDENGVIRAVRRFQGLDASPAPSG